MKTFYFAKIASIAILVGLALPCVAQAQTSKGNGYVAYVTPATAPKASQPPSYVGLLLGGHGDVDEATQALCQHSGGGDLVVLRATESDEYNDEFHKACPGNSVTTLVISSRDGASQAYVADTIRKAHAIFISGGDQSDYVRYWTLNPVQAEINNALARSVPLGGISAGLAVQGEFAFTSMIDTITSPQALADPYGPLVTLSRDFLSIPVLRGIITDSHFSQRKRMGRSVVFLSRIVQDGWASTIHGIGIDETTAVIVDAEGKGRIVGKGAVYFMSLDHRPEQCAYGKALTVRGVKVVKVPAGPNATFDLKSWTGTGGSSFEVNVVEGKMTRSDQN